MRIAYFDCFSGASGDMILGALLDAGLPLEQLTTGLEKLPLSHFHIGTQPTEKMGIAGTQALVEIDQEHHRRHHRHLGDILKMIDSSNLSERIKEKSRAIFVRLAEAEARVHRVSIEAVHFHEVGAADAIIDVVGSVIGLETMRVEALYCSPIHLGSGMVECAHGFLPVPTPATAELTRGVPVYSGKIAAELLTPTGAAILTTLATGFGPLPVMTVERVGYGAGTADLSIPNFLRVMVGTAAAGNQSDDPAAGPNSREAA